MKEFKFLQLGLKLIIWTGFLLTSLTPVAQAAIMNYSTNIYSWVYIFIGSLIAVSLFFKATRVLAISLLIAGIVVYVVINIISEAYLLA